jgi:hypothetical protein
MRFGSSNSRPLSYFILSIVLSMFPLVASATQYQPGQTLNPSCPPSDATCIVVPSTASSINISASFQATSTTATSTFAGSTSVVGTASSTNAVVSNSLTIGSLNGILKAVAGVVTSALVNLSTDVTGVLGIANGGTGTSTAPTYGQMLVGNSSGGYTLLATSSLGIAGASSVAWGNITGTIANQTDLQSALNLKLGSSSLSAAAPLAYNASTGAFSITQAGAGSNGYISSSDWITFNSKLGSTSLSNGTGIGYNSSTDVISNTGVVSLAATYPLQTSGGTGALTISTAFGTTTANTFSALNTFNGGVAANTLNITTSGTLASTTLSGSTLLTNATTTNFAITGVSSTLLKTLSNGALVAAIAGTDYQAAGNYATFDYPFPSNSTSTQIAFNGGASFVGATSTALAVTGSTTISGQLNQNGLALFGGNVGISTTSPMSALSVGGSGQLASFGDTGLSTYLVVAGGSGNNRAVFGFDATNGNAVLQGGGGKGIEFSVGSDILGGGSLSVITSAGNFGIHTLSPTHRFEVQNSITATTSTLTSNYSFTTFNPSGAGDAVVYGNQTILNYNSANSVTNPITASAGIVTEANAFSNQVIGLYGQSTYTGTGYSISNTSVYGGLFQAGATNAAGTIAHVVGVKINPPTLTGSALQAFGLYVGAQASTQASSTSAIQIEALRGKRWVNETA